jgi:hypothetical protein
MTVTSEERVLDAILTWSIEACGFFCWTSVDKFLSTSTPEQLFGERLIAMDTLLPFVRFPLLQLSTLQRVLPVPVLRFNCEVAFSGHTIRLGSNSA